MKEVVLKIDKEECEDTCPIPLELIPNVQEGIDKITYNDKKKVAKIEYDEKKITEDRVIKKLKEIGYKPKK